MLPSDSTAMAAAPAMGKKRRMGLSGVRSTASAAPHSSTTPKISTAPRRFSRRASPRRVVPRSSRAATPPEKSFPSSSSRLRLSRMLATWVSPFSP